MYSEWFCCGGADNPLTPAGARAIGAALLSRATLQRVDIDGACRRGWHIIHVPPDLTQTPSTDCCMCALPRCAEHYNTDAQTVMETVEKMYRRMQDMEQLNFTGTLMATCNPWDRRSRTWCLA